MEEYPEGSAIEVTARVSYWEGGSQVSSTGFVGTTRVARGPISEYWAILGVVVLEEPVSGASAAEESTTTSDATADGDAGDSGVVLVPPGMDPGVLGSPLGGDPDQATQVPDEPEEDSRWSAMEIFLVIIMVVLSLGLVAAVVEWALEKAIAGDRLKGKLGTDLHRIVRGPRSAITGFLNSARKRFDFAREQVRSRQRKALRSKVVAREAKGSVVVSGGHPVSVTAGNRQVAILQPGQPYTRVGFTSDGHSVVQWGPTADDLGVVPTEALQAVDPPPPSLSTPPPPPPP